MSLSDTRVISLLSHFYVPVFTSNEDYAAGSGGVPPEERAELERIRREGHAAKLSVGSVHGFLLGPDGTLRDTMHVAAMKPDALAAMLERHARALNTTAGPLPSSLRSGPPQPPPVSSGVLRLQVTARYLERRGNDLVLVEGAGGNWSALPGEDWLLLAPAEQARWLPAIPDAASRKASERVGFSWKVAQAAAWPLMTRFYPPTENNDLAKNRREEMSVTATIVSHERGGTLLARVEGSLRMKHWFYHKEDGKEVTANVVGYLSLDPQRRQIASFQMATEGAEYGTPGERGAPFGVAVKST